MLAYKGILHHPPFFAFVLIQLSSVLQHRVLPIVRRAMANADKIMSVTTVTVYTWLAAILKYSRVCSAKGTIIPVVAAVED